MRLRFSHHIKSLLERLLYQPLTLADIMAETSERGFSLVIGLLVLPFLFPMPPGFTVILGMGSLLLSAQMAIGLRSPWLPRRVAQFRFSQKLIVLLLKNLGRTTHFLERIARPRWPEIAENHAIWQFNGLCIAWLTLLLMLPIPFTNPIPTVGILLLVVATLESDGLLMCLSYGLTTLITAVFILVVYLLWRSPEWIESLF